MCGVIGIISKTALNNEIYHGILHLQHRGHDAVGVLNYNPHTKQQVLKKSLGLLTDSFITTQPLQGTCWSIGNVRYTTSGNNSLTDAQPLVNEAKQTLGIVVNGNLTNYQGIKNSLITQGAVFTTESDAEIILRSIEQRVCNETCTFNDICEAVSHVYNTLSGAYSVIGMLPGYGLFAFRDPLGIRPLLYGVHPENGSHCFASEVTSLTSLGFKEVKPIQPGEVIFIDHNHQQQQRLIKKTCHAHCSFEYAYFSHPDNTMEGIAVRKARKNLGVALADKIRMMKIAADVVIPIPKTGCLAAAALAEVLDIPYVEGITINVGIGRSFIMPSQMMRERTSQSKFIIDPSVIKGRNILLVDDSIVRGTVSKSVIQQVRTAGAKNVYFASSFPPIKHPCIYGLHFPTNEELIGHHREVEEIARMINADKIIYNDMRDLKEALQIDDFCAGCVTGNYPE